MSDDPSITSLSLDDEHTPVHDPVITITTSDNIEYCTYKSTLVQANYFNTLYSQQWSNNNTKQHYTLFIDRHSCIVHMLLQLLRYNNINCIDFSNTPPHQLHMLLSDVKYYQFNDTLLDQLTSKVHEHTTHQHIDLTIQCNMCASDCRAGRFLYWCKDHFYVPEQCCRKANMQVRLCCKCWGKAYINTVK